MVTSTDAQVSRSLRYDGRHEVEDLLRESFRHMQLVDVHAQVNAEELILSGTAFSWYENNSPRNSPALQPAASASAIRSMFTHC